MRPESVEDLNARLLGERADLPQRLRQCADFVLENPERIAVSTVAELAGLAGVPPSAFVRFCQLFGFSGFSEFQRLYRLMQAPRWPEYGDRIEALRASGQNSATALLADFAEAGRLSLERLVKTIDPASLDAAVETLADASMIHVAGFRRAFPVASYIAYGLDKMEIPAMLHDGMGNFPSGNALRPGDAVIAISFAPYTEATVAFAVQAAGAGLPVVAITDGVASPLRETAAVALSVNEIDVGAFRALTASLALALTLTVALGFRKDAAPG